VNKQSLPWQQKYRKNGNLLFKEEYYWTDEQNGKEVAIAITRTCYSLDTWNGVK
jgi:hypothetical protein